MKLKSIVVAVGPPAIIIVAMAWLRPEMLTWPFIAVAGLVMGVFAALVSRELAPDDDVS